MTGRLTLLGGALLVALIPACAPPPAAPAPAVIRQTPPPWDAPRDAVSQMTAAGVPQLPRGYPVSATRIATLQVVVDGDPVDVPAGIGIDRVRAIDSPLHTHRDDGTVWVEESDADRADDYTLGQFFTLWGVRFADGCLGDACTALSVTVDGMPVNGDPADLTWTDGSSVVVSAQR